MRQSSRLGRRISTWLSYLLAISVLAIVPSALWLPTPPAQAQQFSYNSYTSTPQSLTVPTGVSSVYVSVTGASGGSGGHDGYNGGLSGYVGKVTGTISVTGGSTIMIAIGSGGMDGDGCVTGQGGGLGGLEPTGWTSLIGGAGGNADGLGCSGGGGGGGAASIVVVNGLPIIAAGAGGGAGGNNIGYNAGVEIGVPGIDSGGSSNTGNTSSQSQTNFTSNAYANVTTGGNGSAGANGQTQTGCDGGGAGGGGGGYYQGSGGADAQVAGACATSRTTETTAYGGSAGTNYVPASFSTLTATLNTLPTHLIPGVTNCSTYKAAGSSYSYTQNNSNQYGNGSSGYGCGADGAVTITYGPTVSLSQTSTSIASVTSSTAGTAYIVPVGTSGFSCSSTGAAVQTVSNLTANTAKTFALSGTYTTNTNYFAYVCDSDGASNSVLWGASSTDITYGACGNQTVGSGVTSYSIMSGNGSCAIFFYANSASSNTWTVPSGVTSVTVTAVSGGGGGGQNAGGGGAGGNVVTSTGLSVQAFTVMSISIGAGGTGANTVTTTCTSSPYCGDGGSGGISSTAYVSGPGPSNFSVSSGYTSPGGIASQDAASTSNPNAGGSNGHSAAGGKGTNGGNPVAGGAGTSVTILGTSYTFGGGGGGGGCSTTPGASGGSGGGGAGSSGNIFGGGNGYGLNNGSNGTPNTGGGGGGGSCYYGFGGNGSNGLIVITFAIPANSLTLANTPSTSATVGTSVATSPSVTVRDSAGNTLASYPTTFTVAAGETGTTTVNSNASGVATMGTWTLATLAGQDTVTVTAGTLSLVVTATGTPGSGTVLSITQAIPSTTTAGVALSSQPIFTLLDQYGNRATSDVGSVTASIYSGTGATLLGATSVTPSSGVATFSGLTLNGTNGTQYVLSFGHTGATTVYETTTAATGAAVKLVSGNSPGSPNASGNNLTPQPIVNVVDTAGNIITTDSGLISAAITSGTGGTLSGTTAINAVNGVGTYTNLALSGTLNTQYVITFSRSGLTSLTETITAGVGPATQLILSTQATSSVQSGVAFATQPVVTLKDSGSNIATGDVGPVSVSVYSGTGVLSGTTTINAVSGVDNFSGLILTGSVGTSVLAFTRAGLNTVYETMTITPGPTSTLTLTTSGANSTSGYGFATVPVVTAKDSAGNNVADGTIITATLTLTKGSGLSPTTFKSSGAATMTTTTTGGVATFTGIIIGDATLQALADGIYTITYSSNGVSTSQSNLLSKSHPYAPTGSGTYLTSGMIIDYELNNTSSFAGGSTSVTNLTSTGINGVLSSSQPSSSSGVHIGLANSSLSLRTSSYSDNPTASANYYKYKAGTTSVVATAPAESEFVWVKFDPAGTACASQTGGYNVCNGIILDENGSSDSTWHDSSLEVYHDTLAYRWWNAASQTYAITDVTQNSAVTLKAGLWYYIGMSTTGSTAYGWVNGIQQFSVSSGRNFNPLSAYAWDGVGLGDTQAMYTTTASSFYLCAYHMYNYSLAPSYIKQNYMAGIDGFLSASASKSYGVADSVSPTDTFTVTDINGNPVSGTQVLVTLSGSALQPYNQSGSPTAPTGFSLGLTSGTTWSCFNALCSVYSDSSGNIVVPTAAVPVAGSLTINAYSSPTLDYSTSNLSGYTSTYLPPSYSVTSGTYNAIAQIGDTITARTIATASGDKYLTFNGSNWAQLPLSPIPLLSGLTNLSFEAWIYPTQSCSTQCIIGGKDNEFIFAIGASMGYGSNGLSNQLMWATMYNEGPQSGWQWTGTGVSVPLNQWNHIAFVKNGNTAMSLYLNGVLVYSNTTQPGNFTNSSASIQSGTPSAIIKDSSYYFGIGARGITSNYTSANGGFVGSIDDVHLYNTAISSTQVLSDMKTPTACGTPGLLLYYDFNEGSGSTLNSKCTTSTYNLTLATNTGGGQVLPSFSDVTTTSTANGETTITVSRTIINAAGGYTIPSGVSKVSAVVVAGGGGGGYGNLGGGGGGGGVAVNPTLAVTPTSVMPITIGYGGTTFTGSFVVSTSNSENGLVGGNSTFGGAVAIGGGGGGAAAYNGATSGGSGGGGPYLTNSVGAAASPQPEPSGWTAYGNSGAVGSSSGGGGGGGAGAAGSGINGGAGISNNYTLGGTYGGGGGGWANGVSGTGDASTPYSSSSLTTVSAANQNTGGGGAGGSFGLSGVVVLRYITAVPVHGNPVNETTTAGVAATFSVTSTPVSGLARSFQWLVSSNSGTTWSNVSGGSGATTSAYTTALTTTAMNNNLYEVVVTDTDATTGLSYSDTSTAAALIVNPAIVLTANPTSLTGYYANPMTSVFTVTPGTGTGGDTFTVSPSPATISLDTSTASSGYATLHINTLGVGTWTETVTATDSVGGATSTPIAVVIAQTPTTTSFTYGPATYNAPDTLTATVVESSTVNVSGTITFKDGSNNTLCTTSTFSSSGQASCAWTPGSTNTYAITAYFNLGSSSTAPFAPSQSGATSITPGKAAINLTLNSPAPLNSYIPNTTGNSNAVTLTATLSGQGPASPTGTIAFSVNGSSACNATVSTLVGTCSYTPSGAGIQAVTAVYAGDSTYSGANASGQNVSISSCQETVTVTTYMTGAPGSGYCAVEFTSGSNGTWTVPTGVTNAQVLIVGGGGSGGERAGGGGGAGELLYTSTGTPLALTSNTATVSIGIGGAIGSSGNKGSVGGASSFTLGASTYTASGGGYAGIGGAGTIGTCSSSGGSSGGTDGSNVYCTPLPSGAYYAAYSGFTYAVHSGSYGTDNNSLGTTAGHQNWSGGGGGGSGGDATAGSTTITPTGSGTNDKFTSAGNGGAGSTVSIALNSASACYAAGGGGGVDGNPSFTFNGSTIGDIGNTPGNGGGCGSTVIGGAGSLGATTAGSGVDNTGSGGGGSGFNDLLSSGFNGTPGKGGSGVVIVKYLSPSIITTNWDVLGDTVTVQSNTSFTLTETSTVFAFTRTTQWQYSINGGTTWALETATATAGANSSTGNASPTLSYTFLIRCGLNTGGQCKSATTQYLFRAVVIDTDTATNLVTNSYSPVITVNVTALTVANALTLTSTQGVVGVSLTLTTTGGAGTGAISFAKSGGTAIGCSLSGAALTVTGGGTCNIIPVQAADLDYLIETATATTVTFVVFAVNMQIASPGSGPNIGISGAGPGVSVAAGTAPVISSVSATANLGSTILISGSGFTGATAVALGRSPVTFTFVSDTSILADALVVGTWRIRVTTPGGTALSPTLSQVIQIISIPTPPH